MLIRLAGFVHLKDFLVNNRFDVIGIDCPHEGYEILAVAGSNSSNGSLTGKHLDWIKRRIQRLRRVEMANEGDDASHADGLEALAHRRRAPYLK